MKIDYKVTIWERILVNEEDEQRALEILKEGGDINDLTNEIENLEYTWVDGSTEVITVEENGNQATIEVIQDGKTVWTNDIGQNIVDKVKEAIIQAYYEMDDEQDIDVMIKNLII